MLSMLNPMNSMVSFVLHISGVIVGGMWIFINREIFTSTAKSLQKLTRISVI